MGWQGSRAVLDPRHAQHHARGLSALFLLGPLSATIAFTAAEDTDAVQLCSKALNTLMGWSSLGRRGWCLGVAPAAKGSMGEGDLHLCLLLETPGNRVRRVPTSRSGWAQIF